MVSPHRCCGFPTMAAAWRAADNQGQSRHIVPLLPALKQWEFRVEGAHPCPLFPYAAGLLRWQASGEGAV
jgi:hypothetical protein